MIHHVVHSASATARTSARTSTETSRNLPLHSPPSTVTISEFSEIRNLPVSPSGVDPLCDLDLELVLAHHRRLLLLAGADRSWGPRHGQLVVGMPRTQPLGPLAATQARPRGRRAPATR
jgi:hypothetical protein